MESEKRIERYLADRVEALGGLCLKFTSPGAAGVPDRIIIYHGVHVFVELKAPCGRLSARQNYVQEYMREAGAHVVVLKNLGEVDQFIIALVEAG